MKITWEVDDGYIGGKRPQSTEVDDDDLRDCETFEEARELINDVIQEAFENEITWYLTDESDVLVQLDEMFKDREGEEE